MNLSNDCIDIPKSNKSKVDNNCKYDNDTIFYIRLVYILVSLLWIFLILSLDLVKDDPIVLLILLLPLVVFLINFINIPNFPCNMEETMFSGNFLFFGFVVAIILIDWNSPLAKHDKLEFFKILITAFILLMLSILDLWVDEKKMSVVKHIKTSIQTISLSLLSLALYLYYIHHKYSYSTHF